MPATGAASVSGHERRRRSTNERLLAAALELFAERGYDATSYDEIAERAGVARATVFNHFPRKRAFLEGWGDQRRDVLRAALADDGEGLGTVARIARAVAGWAAAYEHDPQISRLLVRDWVRAGGAAMDDAVRETAALFTRVLREGQERDEVRPDIDAGAAGIALIDMMLGTLFRWAAAEDGEPGRLGAELVPALGVIFRGLLVEVPGAGVG